MTRALFIIASGAIAGAALLAAPGGPAAAALPAAAVPAPSQAAVPASCPGGSAMAAAAARDGTAAGMVRAAAAAAAQPAAAAAAVTALPGAGRGIDISSHNAEPDWATLKAGGTSFVAIKATEGDYYVNEASTSPSQPGYAREAADAMAAGLYVMPYVFANPYPGNASASHPSDGSGTCQADYAWAQVGQAAPAYQASSLTLPVVLDIEQDPYVATEGANATACYGLSQSQMATWIGDFLTRMTVDSGKRPVIYTNPAFWSDCVGSRTTFTTTAQATGSFASYPLWIASFGVSAPAVPAAWAGTATFWQYTDAASVAGVTGTVDADYLMPLEQAGKLGAPAAPVQFRSLSALNGQAVRYTAAGLPPGLAMTAAGRVTGTPAADGSFAVTVTPSAGPALSLTWVVTGPALSVAAQLAQVTPAGAAASRSIAVTDVAKGKPGFALAYSAAGLPPGLSISPASGVISGWVAQPGTFAVKVTVTDGLGGSGTATFSWTVQAVAGRGTTGTIQQHVPAGLCLADPGSRTATATAVAFARCAAQPDQDFTAVQDGTLRVLGHCLTASGASVLLYPCNGSIAEQWVAGAFGSLADVRYGSCLTGPQVAAKAGSRASLAACRDASGRAGQRWNRPPAPAVSGAGDRCVAESRGLAELASCAGAQAQRWMPAASGTFALQIAGYCLTEHAAAGTRLTVTRCSDSAASQQWRLLPAGRVASELQSPATGLCVTAPAGASAGTTLVLGGCASSLLATFRIG